MASRKKKKAVTKREDKEDRISRLPDELIHRILSFTDAEEAVRTCVLRKRWKLIWTTLPFVDFGYYGDFSNTNYNFIVKFLSNRNHQSNILKLSLCIFKIRPPERLVEELIEYAIKHNVENLTLETHYGNQPFELSTFSSNSLKTLDLQTELEVFEPDVWDLPALTTLRLTRPWYDAVKLSDSCFTCLPALKTLGICSWDLSDTSFSFHLPHLTTLCLSGCKLPETIWDFPALLTLELRHVSFPNNMSEIFSTLVNLQNLTLELDYRMKRNYFISCPQLVNLNISTRHCETHGFVVLAPKLSNFSSSGVFPITFGVSELRKVDIKLPEWFEEDTGKYDVQLTSMLLQLGNARILTFDSGSIEALSKISNLVVSLPSPFYNLNFVKLPQKFKESSIPSALRSYLLGGSPRASIVTELPQDNMIPRTATVSLTAENAPLDGPLVAPTKGLVDCQYINKTVNVETVDMGIQEHHVVENSLRDNDRVRQIGSAVKGISNNGVSSSKGIRDFGLWRGYEVNSEFVCLLDRIMLKYPETFEHFTTKNKKLSTVMLNMLCTSLNDFTKLSMAEVDSEIIARFQEIFAFLQSLGFNLSWGLSHLNYIEHIRFSIPLIKKLQAIDCLVDDARSEVQDLQSRVGNAIDKLQNLQTLRAEKMAEIEKKTGTSGTNLTVGFIVDDLLSGP